MQALHNIAMDRYIMYYKIEKSVESLNIGEING